MNSLFSPLKIKSITLRNRIGVSPMCQYSAKEGMPNDWHLVHLGTRAVGGAGLVIAEATGVSLEGRISPGDLGIWSDEHANRFKPICAFIKSQGATPGIQIAHAGRKASTDLPWKGGSWLSVDQGGWPTVAPSAIAFSEKHGVPIALDREGIQKVIRDFVMATQRAFDAGFQVLEIHAAHGYLFHQFLSPLSNTRSDEYGGSLENRMRFPLEVTQAVRNAWPDELPLFVRISASDWVPEGWNENDSIRFATELKKNGVDLIDCSSGGNLPHAPIPVGPLYQTHFAEMIRNEAKILTAAVGMISTAKEAESIVQEGRADLVLLARELLRNPYFPLQAAHDLKQEIVWPDQYLRAKWRESAPRER